MASKEALRKTAVQALQQWPKDHLRPSQLGTLLTTRFAQPSATPSSNPKASTEEQQIKATLSLLANRFQQRYALNAARSATGGLMTPRSQPDYYQKIARDLAAVPTRGWLGWLKNRITGMVRWRA